ncbi:MAG: sulfur carrier protein ThiS [Bacteroidota bacterium]|nr:sulfur carrier protein ThiS [Bacteroidota bacterium]
MQITLNNRIEFIDAEEISFSELMALKNYTFRMLVTKLNNQLVKKEFRDTTFIKDGDNVSVMHLVSGG